MSTIYSIAHGMAQTDKFLIYRDNIEYFHEISYENEVETVENRTRQQECPEDSWPGLYEFDHPRR